MASLRLDGTDDLGAEAAIETMIMYAHRIGERVVATINGVEVEAFPNSMRGDIVSQLAKDFVRATPPSPTSRRIPIETEGVSDPELRAIASAVALVSGLQDVAARHRLIIYLISRFPPDGPEALLVAQAVDAPRVPRRDG